MQNRNRAFDPNLGLEVNMVCTMFPTVAERGKQGLLVKTYLQWLANPRNPYLNLIDFVVRWVQVERLKRGM
jgi:hypothetical protein